MQDCIFCKIVENKIPSAKIYESDQLLAFLDIMPINSGHVLVIPKTHYQDINETPKEILEEMIVTVKKLAPAVMEAVKATGFNLGVNSGRDAGQVVEHTHFHIIPRKKDDGKKPWEGGAYKEGEMEQVARDIIDNL